MDGRGSHIFTAGQWRSLGECLKLSARELQITQFVFDDCREDDIARRLGISPHTVHSYLNRLYRKAGVGSRGQLLVRVFAEHLCVHARGGGERK